MNTWRECKEPNRQRKVSKMYQTLWIMGKIFGCHQMPERSFFIAGRQFPVCARCTGAILGSFVGAGLFVFLKYEMPFWLATVMCMVMLLDWGIQYIKIKKSTNIRRLITGMVCGVGLTEIYLQILQVCIAFYVKFWEAL